MKEWTGKATVENILHVTAFINEQLEALHCPMKAQMQIDVAIDELFSNIAQYAYGQETGDACVRFGFDQAEGMATIAFIDSGTPFDPLAKIDPDVSLTAEERQIGGLGIFLVRKTMDRMNYQRQGDKNILTISKKIREKTESADAQA